MDPNGSVQFPHGYLYDLSLIKLSDRVTVVMEQVNDDWKFIDDYDNLQYNRLLEVSTPDQPFGIRPAAGRTFGRLFGTTIGEAIILHNERLQPTKALASAAREAGPALIKQFSRALLWRTYGTFDSLQGFSGSPLRLVPEPDDKRRIVLGFQNFEWSKRENYPLAKTAEELENQTEVDAAYKVVLAVYPFYGAYRLPTNFRAYKIIKHN
jgi:hypothetical protein